MDVTAVIRHTYPRVTKALAYTKKEAASVEHRFVIVNKRSSFYLASATKNGNHPDITNNICTQILLK